jgi:sterol desaturase/sphingolipid hydroxylase (fatty acid hydroxylase superfamily)
VVRLLAIFGPAIAAALFANARLPLAGSVLYFTGGLFLWTLLEYGIHRFAFHGFLPHFQHHDDPKDTKYITSPLWLSCGTSAMLWVIWRIPTGSWARSALVLAGIISGYLAYEAVHLKIHANEAGGPLLRKLRKRHYYHHFANDHFHYGVTSSVWDRVFGSLPSELSLMGKTLRRQDEL